MVLTTAILQNPPNNHVFHSIHGSVSGYFWHPPWPKTTWGRKSLFHLTVCPSYWLSSYRLQFITQEAKARTQHMSLKRKPHRLLASSRSHSAIFLIHPGPPAYAWYCSQWAELPGISLQSGEYSPACPQGNLMEAVLPLRFPPLRCFKLTTEISCYRGLLCRMAGSISSLYPLASAASLPPPGHFFKRWEVIHLSMHSSYFRFPFVSSILSQQMGSSSVLLKITIMSQVCWPLLCVRCQCK